MVNALGEAFGTILGTSSGSVRTVVMKAIFTGFFPVAIGDLLVNEPRGCTTVMYDSRTESTFIRGTKSDRFERTEQHGTYEVQLTIVRRL